MTPLPKNYKKKTIKGPYGLLLSLDIHKVDERFFTAEFLKPFIEGLCDTIKFKRGPFHSWGNDYNENEEKKVKCDGISCIQFLEHSSITCHAIDELGYIFIDIFTCDTFSPSLAEQYILSKLNKDIEIVSETKIIRH